MALAAEGPGEHVTTISGWMPGSGLIRLDLDEEGVARGRRRAGGSWIG
ncbi:hypothetical protein [Streptomyces thermoalcalitolerans]